MSMNQFFSIQLFSKLPKLCSSLYRTLLFLKIVLINTERERKGYITGEPFLNLKHIKSMRDKYFAVKAKVLPLSVCISKIRSHRKQSLNLADNLFSEKIFRKNNCIKLKSNRTYYNINTYAFLNRAQCVE